MDYTSVFDLITRTFADQLHGTSVFETSTGESLRVDLAIEDQYFRATFQDSTGRILVITPGNVTAFDNDQMQQSEQTDTQSAFDAWKSQPPVTLAPISAGLAQLTTSNPQINRLIAQIIPSGGSLAFTLLPDLCWFDARYPQVILPGLDLKDFTGRICFRDIAFTSSKISFSIELHGICQLGQVSFGDSFVMQIQKLQLDLHSSVFLELANSNVMGEIWHSLLSAEKGTVKINIADKPSPLTLEVEEISASFNDMKLHQSISSGGSEKTYVDGGPVTLFLKDTNIASYDFDRLDPNILVSLVSANLLDTRIDIQFNSGKNTNPYLYGTFSISTLTARANVKLPDLVATNLEAELSLQGQFSSSHLAIDHISLTSNTGELAFQDFKISNFTTSILVSDLISSKGKLESGQIQICLYPSSGDSIDVVFPPEIKKAELRLAQMTNGKFEGAS
jgi:hypothetical protein